MLCKAFAAQTGRTLGAHKPQKSDRVQPVWTLAEARVFPQARSGALLRCRIDGRVEPVSGPRSDSPGEFGERSGH
ncbi:hypothetical protein AB0H83_48015, partial [Dactylosporangium sp. NPDC050688]